MTRARPAFAALALAAALTSGVDAHKPITSPFTYSTDVAPILKERCGDCHKPGGVAPMSLLTHADTVPWGESMRGELLAGHMPPWSVDRGAARLRNAGGLTAREFNTLLTWLTGGTPPGDGAPAAPAGAVAPAWSLGDPDEVFPLPRVTLAAGEQERIAEFTLPASSHQRALRAIDLLPGTPAVVRSATIELAGPRSAPGARHERLLSLWVPGDDPSALDVGALMIPAGDTIRVRVRYRKTWEYERTEMTDESRVGLYFASADQPTLEAVPISPAAGVTLSRASRVVAIYPDAALADTSVVVTATEPGGRRQELIAFRPRRDWARRYWFREPVSLSRGTRLTMRATPEPATLIPPGVTVTRPPTTRPVPRVYVNVVH